MKERKMLNALTCLVLVAMLLVGCSTSPAETPAKDEAVDNKVSEEVTKPGADDKLIAGFTNRGMENPYYVQVSEGMKLFLDSLGVEYELQILDGQGSDEKQIEDVRAFCEAGGDILYVEMNNDTILAPIAEICEEYGVYWSSTWSLLDGLYPKDYKYYAFHQTPDNSELGYGIAKYMFEQYETPGSGNVLIMQGNLGNSASAERHKGILRALEEYPNITVLDDQPGNFSSQDALDLMKSWLSKYGDDIDGVWCANDTMALAVVEALRAEDLVGKVLVCGIDGSPDGYTAILNGDMIATGDAQGYLQGGYGMAQLYACYTGELDVSTLTDEERVFFTPIEIGTPENAEEITSSLPEYDYSDLDFFHAGAVPYTDPSYGVDN